MEAPALDQWAAWGDLVDRLEGSLVPDPEWAAQRAVSGDL